MVFTWSLADQLQRFTIGENVATRFQKMVLLWLKDTWELERRFS